MSGSFAWQRLSGFHVPFQCRDETVERARSRFVLCLAFRQGFRYRWKTDEPPPVLLPLHFVSISKRHRQFSSSSLVSPNCWSIALRRPGPISFLRSFSVVNLAP